MGDPVIRRVRRSIDEAKNRGGMQAGMPKVTIDAADAERLCIMAELFADIKSGQGAEPSFWAAEAQETEQLIDGSPRRLWWECRPGVGTPYYTHPQPAQQGVPEEAVSLARKWLGITESSLLHNDDITKMAEALLATSQPAKQGVPEEEERLTDIYRRKFFECHDELNNLRSEYHNRTAELETEIEDLHEELQSMRHQPAVPEGWKLVPVEPTAAMIIAFERAPCAENYTDAATWVWEAMVDAAPQPEGGEWVNLVEDLANRAESENISVEVVFDDGYTREGFDTDISEHVANWLRSIKRPQPPKEGE